MDIAKLSNVRIEDFFIFGEDSNGATWMLNTELWPEWTDESDNPEWFVVHH